MGPILPGSTGRLRRHQIVQQQARMTRQETEKRLGWTLGLATALLPILQGIDTDAQSDGETRLAHAQEGRSKCSHIPFLYVPWMILWRTAPGS
jgi:hypothetical protein